ncbi:MAG: hypothetical protein AAGD43_07500 [Pseudomonadota bacterium]
MMDKPRGIGVFLHTWMSWPNRLLLTAHESMQDAFNCTDYGFTSDRFGRLLEQNFRDLKADDIRVIVESIAEDARDLRSKKKAILPWIYSQCLADAGVKIVFPGGNPKIECAGARFENWAALAQKFDPDGLVCFALAQRLGSPNLPRAVAQTLPHWPIYYASSDIDLQLLCERGLTDLHVHFKSLWPASLSWQRVLPIPLDPGSQANVSALRAIHDLPKESRRRRLIESVLATERGSSARISRLLSLRGSPTRFFWSDRRTPRSIGAILVPERTMLTRAWQALLLATDSNQRLEVELNRYLVAKAVFRSLHTQTRDESNRGLIAFDKLRRNNSHLGRLDREEIARGSLSYRRFCRNNGLLVRALQETVGLGRSEVRIAPPDGPVYLLSKLYNSTFLAFDRLAKELEESRADPRSEPCDIRLGIHFKRMVKDTQRGTSVVLPRPATQPLLEKLQEYDRETAAFQLARIKALQNPQLRNSEGTLEKMRLAMARLSRLDLASPERGAGPWHIAPYIRLLKGELEGERFLLQDSSQAYFKRWRGLTKNHRNRKPHTAPELRLTCHAGEDYYTLVDGLWHIEGAISTWGLREGDALGHCLALGIPPRAFAAWHHQGIRVPTGLEFDSLVWLWTLARRVGWRDHVTANKLEHAIREMAHIIYRDLPGHLRSVAGDLELHEEKIGILHHPLLVPPEFEARRTHLLSPNDIPRHLEQSRALRLHDTFNISVTDRRTHRKPPSQIHEQICELLREVQHHICGVICDRGLVIETNPSSNSRMERLQDPRKLPILNLLDEVAQAPRITVCTDNPGTYETDISAEYALLFSALTRGEKSGERDRALAILERMRADGQNLFRGFATLSH